jgi:hypothetical protein
MEPADLRLEQPTLEDVFLRITQAPGGVPPER